MVFIPRGETVCFFLYLTFWILFSTPVLSRWSESRWSDRTPPQDAGLKPGSSCRHPSVNVHRVEEAQTWDREEGRPFLGDLKGTRCLSRLYSPSLPSSEPKVPGCTVSGTAGTRCRLLYIRSTGTFDRRFTVS